MAIDFLRRNTRGAGRGTKNGESAGPAVGEGGQAGYKKKRGGAQTGGVDSEQLATARPETSLARNKPA